MQFGTDTGAPAPVFYHVSLSEGMSGNLIADNVPILTLAGNSNFPYPLPEPYLMMRGTILSGQLTNDADLPNLGTDLVFHGRALPLSYPGQRTLEPTFGTRSANVQMPPSHKDLSIPMIRACRSEAFVTNGPWNPQRPNGRPPGQALSPQPLGFPTPSMPAARQDNLHMSPSPLGIRQQAAGEARRDVQDNPSAIVTAEIIGMGVREALASAGLLTQDPSLLHGNVKAIPIEEFRQVIVLPDGADAVTIASAIAFAKANAVPPGYTGTISTTYPFLTPPLSLSNLVFVSGSGVALETEVKVGEIAVIDELGITSFDSSAELEVAFQLAHGDAPDGNRIQNNVSLQLFKQRAGWPFGTAGDPAHLNGRERLAPWRGPVKKDTKVYLLATHEGETSSSYKPSFHYFEVVLRGWRMVIGPDALPALRRRRRPRSGEALTMAMTTTRPVKLVTLSNADTVLAPIVLEIPCDGMGRVVANFAYTAPVIAPTIEFSMDNLNWDSGPQSAAVDNTAAAGITLWRLDLEIRAWKSLRLTITAPGVGQSVRGSARLLPVEEET